jgi:hypothetical protein
MLARLDSMIHKRCAMGHKILDRLCASSDDEHRHAHATVVVKVE